MGGWDVVEEEEDYSLEGGDDQFLFPRGEGGLKDALAKVVAPCQLPSLMLCRVKLGERGKVGGELLGKDAGDVGVGGPGGHAEDVNV